MVRSAELSAQSAQELARRSLTKLESLQMDVERLLMITEAFWMILKEKHGYQDADLAKLIGQIDMRDGRLDGKVAKTPPRECPHCGHTLVKKRPACIYCGQPVMPDPFER